MSTALQAHDVAISVLVADQSRMVSQLLANSLARKSGLKIAGAVVDAAQALQILRAEQVHIALISANLKDGSFAGFSLLRQLRADYPRIRAVLLLDELEDDLVLKAFCGGARGVFCRSGSVKMLCKCIYAVHQGQTWANADQMQVILEALETQAPVRPKPSSREATNRHSKRERDVLACVAEGMTNREIAEHLNLSEHTVKNYLFRLCDKVGSSGRVELMLYALTHGKLAGVEFAHSRPDTIGAA